jgi:hypothetical protein
MPGTNDVGDFLGATDSSEWDALDDLVESAVAKFIEHRRGEVPRTNGVHAYSASGGPLDGEVTGEPEQPGFLTRPTPLAVCRR